jgi:hypothetical protein
MPAQNRRRGDRKHFGPPAAVNQSRQRRKPEPIGVTPPRPATELTAEHLILVTEHQQLNVLDRSERIRAASRPNKHRTIR